MTVEHSYRTYKEEPVEHKPYIVYSEDENTDVRKVIADVNEEIITNAVDDWLDDHPEATTTVQDGSISVAKLAADTVSLIDSKASADAYAPLLTAGAAYTLLSTDEQTATFTQRVSEGASVGVKAVLGNTVVWNQIAKTVGDSVYGSTGCTTTVNDGVAECVTIIQTTHYYDCSYNFNVALITGHKVLIVGDVKGEYANTHGVGITNSTVVETQGYSNVGNWQRVSVIATVGNGSHIAQWYVCGSSGTTPIDTVYQLKNLMLFDLTAMFGAGNEPQSVAEFEALYPEAYYPYDAGSLLSVTMEGVETVGFNQWDEEWEVGDINQSTGQNSPSSNRIRCKNYIPIVPGTQYYIRLPYSGDAPAYFYDADKNYITPYFGGVTGVFTPPANARYMRFRLAIDYGTTYKNDVCINLSWSGYRNGEYEPYWEFERAIDVETYFPSGMRSAGSVYDELTGDKAITRVGAVDLGTLDWSYESQFNLPRFNALVDGMITTQPYDDGIVCTIYQADRSPLTTQTLDKTISRNNNGRVYILDSAYTDADTFTAAMDGVILYYELATPTTTEIDPPINMDYLTQQGGVESIVIPTGEMSAPITLVYVQGYDADGVADRALSVIAPLEGAKASTNYAIDSYFIQAGKLYKVTSAIATGEDITPGTNCTETIVMAEILAIE